MKKTLLISLAIAGFTLTGCSYALEEVGLFKTSDGLPKVGAFQFADQKVSFEVVASVSMRTCLECHATGNRSMNTAEKVLAQKDSILGAVNKESMPPRSSGYKPLTACEKQILETWIEDQTHNRIEVQKVKDLPACAGLEAPKAKPKTDFKTLELSFENLKTEILAPKCLSCHTTETAKKTVLEDLEHINAKELIKETAEDSLLYKIVVPGMYKRFMPPTRTGIAPLTADELDYLKRWIDSGAKY
ncbi:c-type cytochrome [uncultured Bdellovibrio sp.]|uniref:c-type cytochrome n=1 Tax=Bdellovibrio sp. HCB-162 TaxID=3394234 RepID=UPI0025D73A20|nr:hypothetical protein [uncultured Bdellovibrio sp.]